MGYCAKCGEWSDNLRPANNRCQKCETEDHKQWRMKRRSNSAISLDEWKKKIANIPYPYSTLTEAEWLNACKHFGGCAYCGKPDIDARSMFIQFKDGGRYCAWNIVPACEKCETALKQTNPFSFMDTKLYRGNGYLAKKLGFSLDNLQKIVEYLQTKMEEVK